MRVGRETGEEWGGVGGGGHTRHMGFQNFHKDIISVIIKF